MKNITLQTIRDIVRQDTKDYLTEAQFFAQRKYGKRIELIWEDDSVQRFAIIRFGEMIDEIIQDPIKQYRFYFRNGEIS